MSRAQLKAYGPQARRDFIEMVTREAAVYGLTKSKIEPVEVTGDTAVIKGTAYPKRVARQRRQLDELVQRQGFEQTMEAMAYTWFNRFMAIRYMELHGYLDHGYRVLSHPSGDATPEILQHAERVELPGLDKQAVIDLKLDGTRDTELYRKLIVTQCNALHGAMPFLFERIDDATELLLPADLLHSESVTRKMVDSIDEEDWGEVEIVGWLYQFYISEKKDQVIGKVVKSEDIPAATQLFTPNWIVKYMLHNSLGAKWLATYPDSSLRSQMDFYIEPAEQDEDVQRQLKEITPESLNPEEITLLDPACGSGHILVEAYELFKAIYQERGYRAKDIPRLVLEKNLYGLEIDERAAQLSSFALLMKARADDRGLFSEPVALNVCCIQESNGLEIDNPGLTALFHNAKTYGSLIRVQEDLGFSLEDLEVSAASDAESAPLFATGGAFAKLMLLRQARILSSKFDVVVANPPYMGGKGMNGELKSFAKEHYPDSKSDTFAMFIEQGFNLAKSTIGYNALVTMQSWMFLSSYEEMRKKMLKDKTFLTMAHLGARAFGSISGEVVQTSAFSVLNSAIIGYYPTFFRLIDGDEEAKRIALLTEEIRFERVRQDEFQKIPGSPIAYWLSDAIRDIYCSSPRMDSVLNAEVGLQTSNNARFVRLWNEVSIERISFDSSSSEEAKATLVKWFPYNKGGANRKWYGNHESIVNWENDGEEIKEYVSAKYPYLKGNTDYVIKDRGWFFKPSVSWSDLTSGANSFRFYPRGFVFDVCGMSAYPSCEISAGLLATCNTNFVNVIVKSLNPTFHFQVGNFRELPFLEKSINSEETKLLAAQLIREHKTDWDAYERSWSFQSLPVLTVSSRPSPALESSYTAWITQNRNTIVEIKRMEEENNQLFIEAYCLHDEISHEVPIEQITLTVNPPYRYGPGKTDEEYDSLFRADTMKELLSYAIGCMMGRYSLDDPGLIYAHSGNQGFDASRHTTFPADEDGILPVTDVDWFQDDIANRAVEFVATAWQKEHLEENLNFLADSLDRKSSESSRECIRRYLSRDFYKDHLQTYKRRPIYWLFCSGKLRAFQCLVYLHRYNEGTLARMRTEYVIPLQSKMTARLEHLKDDIANATSTAQAKKLEKEQDLIRKQQAELLTFDEKLRHCADQRITLDLDDGVKVNYGKFGDLLAEAKAVTGGKGEDS
jgi:type II restriction/modification system DNA methylase subunit YeeA